MPPLSPTSAGPASSTFTRHLTHLAICFNGAFSSLLTWSWDSSLQRSSRLAILTTNWRDKLVKVQGDAIKMYECTVDIERYIQQENLWTDIDAWLVHCLNSPPSIYRHVDRSIMLETFLGILSSPSGETIQDYLACYKQSLSGEEQDLNHSDSEREEECLDEEELERRAAQTSDELKKQEGKSDMLPNFLKGVTFDEFKKPIVDAICSMKTEVTLSETHSAEFHRAVKDTGLMQLIETICNPAFLIQHRERHNSKS
ncbi:hypothetical protein BDP27DRAFT_1409624 [Rhodocollybia butyracea]|uniref:Uncharacterized protein n=1 Tax=Rhodocollybia butyracea TaxID=206335 RepID=A0A9P5P5R0_9AGAR|nr:hypothetical protein BDP27DRAFT_1409624 [Rhodocollybia butyracea]